MQETGYGHDIATRRVDDLERKLLAAVKDLPAARVLDLGCGAGGSAGRLATTGASVVGIDVHDFTPAFTTLRQQHDLLVEQLHFIQGDIRKVAELVPNQQFDFCLIHRALHYLRYQEAEALLAALRTRVREKIFISFTGLETDIGEHYPANELPITDRFHTLTSQEAQTDFAITTPLCLYTPEEAMQLLVTSGWQIEELWLSAFGNIKAVCR